jgi:hypothetical protein
MVYIPMSPFRLRKKKSGDQGPLKKTIRSNKESNDEINIRADVGKVKKRWSLRFSYWIVLLTSL